MTREEIERRVRNLGQWFHNMDLGGVKTAPQHFLGDYPRLKWERFAHCIPGDLRGASVLDVGCNAGFYSIEMKRRGADRVLALDSDEQYLAQARLAAEINDVEIEFRQMSVYDVGALRERFDWVLFLGVFYHLRHPLLALDLLHQHVASKMFLFQSMLRGSVEVDSLRGDYPFQETGVFERPGYPKMYFVEKKYSGDPTNWWIPNTACAQALLRSAGFEILEQPEAEVFLCRYQPTDEPLAVYPARGEGAHS